MEWMFLPLKRYAEFAGRSRRREYWMFVLFQLLIYTALTVAAITLSAAMGDYADNEDPQNGGKVVVLVFLALGVITWLGLLVPNLAVIARRMQDQNIHGAVGIILYLFGLLIGFTGLILLILSLIPGTRGPNRYGEDPKSWSPGDIFA